ncbi:shikimate dehydrogenase [Luteolibacter algae]|uniref:Shikimate dehydrogenase (NADP(+)) n=1 Tax=Luteolibacter algae TaxID=454151 RepID=A0ABW5DBN8_9BACT
MLPVYTLESIAQTRRDPKPARLAVLGYPVSHSASPQLHQPALDAFGINARYVRLEVEPGELQKAFSLMQELNFIGCNVTVPHKFEAMAACSEVSAQAEILGAVNTVVFDNQKIIGHNTDGPGFMQAIKEAFDLHLGDIHCLVLGAGGGAGQAIASQCALQKPAELTLVNRSLDKIHKLVARLELLSPETRFHALTFQDPSLEAHCHAARLLIQTTSLGLKPDDAEVIPGSYMRADHCAYDTIYKPAETPFLASAKRAGCRTDNGLSLLIHQGAIAFQHWFPATDPLSYMRQAMQTGK